MLEYCKVTTHLLTHYCLTLYYGDAGSADDDGRGGLARRRAGRVPGGGGDGASGGAAGSESGEAAAGRAYARVTLPLHPPLPCYVPLHPPLRRRPTE